MRPSLTHHILTLILITFLSCSLISCGKATSISSNTNLQSETEANAFSTTPVIIKQNIHSSLPEDWISDYHIIMNNLKTTLPLYQIYYKSIDIYAWNDNTEDPFPGIDGGAYISGKNNDPTQKLFVIEIPNSEFTWNSMHRFSVIAHEYFHTYQLTLNEHMNKYDDHPTSFKTKWLVEGVAASFESIFIQQYYNKNYFLEGQNSVDLEATSNPSMFEKKDNSGKDQNYSSSTFLILVLAKELQLAGHSESEAFKLIFKNFMQAQPNKTNWKDIFQSTFNISIQNFYTKLSNYTPSIDTVLPSSTLTIESIFN